MESAARGSAMISGEAAAVNKLGNYSYTKLKQNVEKNSNNNMLKQSNSNKKPKTYNCLTVVKRFLGQFTNTKKIVLLYITLVVNVTNKGILKLFADASLPM